jgi:hypothetical protein
MTTLKFEQFAPGGSLLSTDSVVGLRAGVSTIFNVLGVVDALIKTNNLSDVTDPVLSLANIGGQPISLTGAGSPNGTQAGAEGITFYYDTVTKDRWQCVTTGTTLTAVWSRLVTQENSFTNFSFWVSDIKGDDTIGNGSIDFPYKTYAAAAAAALLVASESTPATVYIMDSFSAAGIILYPFVNISGSNPNVVRMSTTGTITLDATFDTILNATTYLSYLSIEADAGVNLIFTASQSQKIIFYNSQMINTPTVNIEGSGLGAENELILFFAGITVPPFTAPTYTLKNITTVFNNFTANGITMVNALATNQSILGILDCATPSSLGPIVIQSSAPDPGAVLYAANSFVSTLNLDGDMALTVWDATSYSLSISLTSGATFSNITNLTISDALRVTNFTPVNYTLPPTPALYAEDSTTNHLAGIDTSLGSSEIIPAFASVAFSEPSPTVIALHSTIDTPIEVPVFDVPILSTDFTVDSMTGLITYSGAVPRYFLISYFASCKVDFSFPVKFFIAINAVSDPRTEQNVLVTTASATIGLSNFVLSLSPGDTILAHARNDSVTSIDLFVETSTITIVKC